MNEDDTESDGTSGWRDIRYSGQWPPLPSAVHEVPVSQVNCTSTVNRYLMPHSYSSSEATYAQSVSAHSLPESMYIPAYNSQQAQLFVGLHRHPHLIPSLTSRFGSGNIQFSSAEVRTLLFDLQKSSQRGHYSPLSRPFLHRQTSSATSLSSSPLMPYFAAVPRFAPSMSTRSPYNQPSIIPYDTSSTQFPAVPSNFLRTDQTAPVVNRSDSAAQIMSTAFAGYPSVMERAALYNSLCSTVEQLPTPFIKPLDLTTSLSSLGHGSSKESGRRTFTPYPPALSEHQPSEQSSMTGFLSVNSSTATSGTSSGRLGFIEHRKRSKLEEGQTTFAFPRLAGIRKLAGRSATGSSPSAGDNKTPSPSASRKVSFGPVPVRTLPSSSQEHCFRLLHDFRQSNPFMSSSQELVTIDSVREVKEADLRPSQETFIHGTKIQLADGRVKRIEHLSSDDFFVSSKFHHYEVGTATVDKIVHLETKTNIIFNISNKMVNVEVSLEQPFFVINKGWCSPKPDRTLFQFGLSCQLLCVGDKCISLIDDSASSANKSNVVEEYGKKEEEEISSASTVHQVGIIGMMERSTNEWTVSPRNTLSSVTQSNIDDTATSSASSSQMTQVFAAITVAPVSVGRRLLPAPFRPWRPLPLQSSQLVDESGTQHRTSLSVVSTPASTVLSSANTLITKRRRLSAPD